MRHPIVWLIVVFALGAAALLYLRPRTEQPEPDVEEATTATAEPEVRYPIDGVQPPDDPAAPPLGPLPPLGESDAAVRDALGGLLGSRLDKFINTRDIIRRVVATIDSLPRDHLPQELIPVKSPAGLPLTIGKGDNLTLSQKNAARYAPYVRLVEAVPTGPLVAVYARFYPLFQEQYEKLGYPDRYFNDRLVEVIDHLLAAPEVHGPVHLTQPKVLYQFADPKLERLSAGQKILVRIGPANAARIKMKLQEIRREVTQQAP